MGGGVLMFVDQRSDLLWSVLVKGFLRGINFYGAFGGVETPGNSKGYNQNCGKMIFSFNNVWVLLIGGHPVKKFAKFTEKLIFLTP